MSYHEKFHYCEFPANEFTVLSDQKVKSLLDYKFIYPDLLCLLQQTEFSNCP